MPNRRLDKYQIIKAGVEFDIYVERQNRLPVPYEELATFAERPRQLRVAALEHLLVLKAAAAVDRHGSAKGEKDRRDVATIVLLMPAPRQHLVEHRITDAMRAMVDSIGHDTLLAIAQGNAHVARRLHSEVIVNRSALWTRRS